MTFLTSAKTCLKKAFTFSGRASRSEFWWFQLFFIISIYVISLIAIALMPIMYFGVKDVSAVSVLVCIVTFIISIAILIYIIVGAFASLSVTVRRFHDTNRSGWLVLLFWLLNCFPLVNIISFIVCIVFLCQAGTEGDNRFGAIPE